MICINLPKVAAINSPHGDQVAWLMLSVVPMLAVHESHEAGIPVTTLATWEWTSWPYSFQMIIDLGANEGYRLTDDLIEFSDKVMTVSSSTNQSIDADGQLDLTLG